MTEVQDVTKQIANYEAKVNATQYQCQRAVQEIDFCRQERARLEVLVELGEVNLGDLVAIDKRQQSAAYERDEAASQLELSGRALAELNARLEEARKRERVEAKHQALLDYRETAKELLELLGPIAERYEALGALHRKVGDSRLEGAGRAGLMATGAWPEALRRDLQKIEARLGDRA